MTIYIVTYFVLLYNTIVLYRVRIVQVLLLLAISFIIGFRGMYVGTDTPNYVEMFESIDSKGYDGYPEPLYGISCMLFSLIGFSYPWHQAILCFFSLMVAYLVIKKSPNVGMSIFLLLTFCYFSYTMNIFGQMIACFISLYAMSFLKCARKYDKLRFLFFLLIAIGFHYSALFLLPLVFIDKIKINGYIIFFGLLVSLILGAANFTSLFSSYMLNYDRHLNRVIDNTRLIQGILLSFYWMFLYIVLYCTSDKQLQKSVELRVFFIGLLLYNFFLSNDMAMRFLFYFLIPMIIWIPQYLKYSRKKKRVRQLFVILYSSLFYFMILYMNTGDIIPYKMFKSV